VSLPPIRVRPAAPGDQDQIWPLARALATSYVVQRPAFNRSFAFLLADPTALVLAPKPPPTPATPTPVTSAPVSIAFDDPDLAIPWPLPPVMMSARDRSAPSLEVALKQLGEAPR
jgi:hypothetical protein